MTDKKAAYILFCKIIFVFLFLIILYTVLANNTGISLQCQYKINYGKSCRSCGLTRGLYKCFKLDFKNANQLNNQSEFIFIVIISQIFLRILLILFSEKLFKNISIKIIVLFDVSALIFLYLFNLCHY